MKLLHPFLSHIHCTRVFLSRGGEEISAISKINLVEVVKRKDFAAFESDIAIDNRQ